MNYDRIVHTQSFAHIHVGQHATYVYIYIYGYKDAYVAIITSKIGNFHSRFIEHPYRGLCLSSSCDDRMKCTAGKMHLYAYIAHSGIHCENGLIS